MASYPDSMSSTTSEGTGDFDILRRDLEQEMDDDNDDDLQLEGAAMARLVQKRVDAIARVCRILCPDDSSRRRPLRIVFLGKHGSGKSSFINSVGAAFSEERWREYAYTGYHGGSAEPITIFTQKFEKCCNEELERYRDVPLPTLIDVAGKMDINDEKMEELLRLIFYGHIEEDGAIMKAYDFCERHTREEIRAEYSVAYPDMKVDRVVFVASAVDKIPEKLISAVIRAARPLHYSDVRRTIPVFGVLTKKDKVSDVESSEFQEKKETFKGALGLQANRFLCCSNYCDDVDPKGKRTRRLDPRLDVPIVEFFEQLCDPALRIIQDQEELPSADGQQRRKAEQAGGRAGEQVPGAVPQIQAIWRDLGPTVQALVVSVSLTLFLWMVLYVFLVIPASGGFEATVREACQKGAIKDPAILDVCKTAPPTSPVLGTTMISFTVGIGCFLYMVLGRRA